MFALETKPASIQDLLDAARQRNPGILNRPNKQRFGFIPAKYIQHSTHEQGVSFNRRETMRRNRAAHGSRQICIVLVGNEMAIHRDYHMPAAERKAPETKMLAALEAYRHSLYTSGYRLLDANPHSLIFQYEGRIH